MNALRSLNRRRFLQSTGFLALSFPVSLDLAFGAEKSGKLPGSLADNPMLSAWLRINADKSVTLLIGKVELGQGALTAIGQVCADELVVNYDRLRVISGDTALSPNEGTTSGSQTMSDGATAVREASAEGREFLLDLAALKLGQPDPAEFRGLRR